MSKNIIGKCSICGGDVAAPEYGYFGDPPLWCLNCGARKSNTKALRIINMEKIEDFRDMPRESQQEYFGINKK